MTNTADEVQQVRDGEDTHKHESLSLNVTLGRASFKGHGDAAAVLGAFGSFQEFYAAQAANVEEADSDGLPAQADAAPNPSVAQVNQKPAGGNDSVPLSVFLGRKKVPRGYGRVGALVLAGPLPT